MLTVIQLHIASVNKQNIHTGTTLCHAPRVLNAPGNRGKAVGKCYRVYNPHLAQKEDNPVLLTR